MNVPDGWRAALLSNVCTVGPRDPALPETAPFVPMDAVKVGVREPAYYEPRGKRGGIRAKDNDLLFARITPCLENGKVSLLPPSSGPTGGSTEFLVVRPGTNVDPRYLYLWSLNPAVRERAKAEMTGTTGRMRLSGSALGALPFPHPPLPEQRRIVEVVEEHMARLDAADASLASAERRMRQWSAVSLERVIWGTAAQDVSVGEILREPMRNGRSDRASISGEGTRTLTLTAVTKRSFTDQHTKITSTPADVASNLWLEPGDILVQRSNTPELVGTSARYQGPREWAIFPDLLIRIRPDESRMRSDFLDLALRTERSHRTLRSKAKGLAGSMPKIDQAALAGTRVPCPPAEIQRALVSEAHDVQAQADAALAAIGKSRLRSAALRRAVLAAAFSGRLTPDHGLNG